MTTLYKSVEVETVEQLIDLPPETIMRARTGALCETGLIPGTDRPCVWAEGWLTLADAIEHLAPMTALVPVEAEEEFTATGEDHGDPWIANLGFDGLDGTREEAEAYTRRFGGVVARRLVTPWEEA